MRKSISLTLSFFLLSTWAMAQTKLIEKVSKKGKEIVIPYEKYVLPNGLTLIVHEDKSDPIVHVDVTYHVGSAREEIGKSGFAHFFEHMMFQGSDNVADEEHFKIVTESGGTLNGTTNRDRTNYFETLPSNQLEVALWLEADRMGFLLDAVTQQKFEIQRATVKNERGQNYDNRPYGLAGEVTSKNMYPYGHPYSWLTIGYVEDLDRVNVDDLKNFFLRWYGPNNAVLTVGGDVNAKEVVKLVEKYFGSIPRGPEVKNMPKMPAKLDKDRYVSYEDNYIQLPLLRLNYPAVERYHKDEAALDCLAEILGQGKNSIFYKNFVKSRKALQASANNSASELSGEFGFTVVPFPGTGLADMEKIVRESLLEFEQKGVSDDDLLRFKAGVESSMINRLQSVSGKVSMLAAYQTFAGNPNMIGRELKAAQAVTKADVMRVYNQYIKNKPSVILSVYPKGKPELRAAEDNYTVSEAGYKAPDYGYAGLKYNKAKDNFDRSKRPGPGANPVINVPPMWSKEMANGIKVIGTKNDEIPTLTMLLRINGGHQLSAQNLSKAGVASLTASMLNEDTEKYSAEDITSELDKLGSSISFGASGSDMTVSVFSLVKNLDKTLELLEEKLFRPAFNAEDFDRLKKQQLEGIKNQATQPAVIASNNFMKLLYGHNDIRAIPTIGTTESVNNISLDDVKAFYQMSFAPNVTSIVVVGDIEEKEVLPKLAFLNKWQKKEVPATKLPQAKAIDKTRLYLIDKPKAAQSEIRIGYVTNMPYDATGEFYRTTLMNYPLGGAFNSRINLNLREDKGWTYGARTTFMGTKTDGWFMFSSGVKANATDSSVVEVMKELRQYYEQGITDAELAFLKSSIGQSEARNYETGFQKAGFLGRIIEYGLEQNYTTTQNNILNSIGKQEINALTRKLLNPDKMAILVVGDKELVKPGLERLGYEIVELDVDGKVVESKKLVETEIQKEVITETPQESKKSKKEKKAKEPKAKKEKKSK